MQTFCYPSNVYHREVLEPYVYPALDHAQTRLLSNPAYKNVVEPGYAVARDSSKRLWQGPLRPVVDRVSRGARRVYLTFVEPHLPYLLARFHALTAPYTSRLSAFHQTHVSPRLVMAQAYAKTASDRSVNTYNYVSTHPLTDTIRKYANVGFQFGRRKGYDAYVLIRPHVVRAIERAEVIAKEVLGPRAVAGLEWGADRAARGWEVLKLCAGLSQLCR